MESNVMCKAHVLGGGGANSQQLPETEWEALYSDGRVIEPPYDLMALAELYGSNATHKACVDAKATNIVGLGYRFVPRTADASTDALKYVSDLLEHCNREMTFSDIIRAVWTDVEVTGNGYLEVGRNDAGQICAFFHVPATSVRIAAGHNSFIQIRGGRQQRFRAMGVAYEDEELDGCNELIHFCKYTPQSTYYGVPDITAAMWAIAGDKAALRYNLDFFEHNAVPRMAVMIEGGTASPELLRRIQQFMENDIRGEGHKTLVLEVPGQDVKIRLEPLTVGVTEDAAFLEYRKANRDEIMMVHRVPPSKITVIENANLANSKDQDKTFREQVIRPEQRKVEFLLNKLIHEEIGVTDWDFKFREMDLDEEREQAEITRVYSELGVLNIDEIRAQLGLEQLDKETADG